MILIELPESIIAIAVIGLLVVWHYTSTKNVLSFFIVTALATVLSIRCHKGLFRRARSRCLLSRAMARIRDYSTRIH